MHRCLKEKNIIQKIKSDLISQPSHFKCNSPSVLPKCTLKSKACGAVWLLSFIVLIKKTSALHFFSFMGQMFPGQLLQVISGDSGGMVSAVYVTKGLFPQLVGSPC